MKGFLKRDAYLLIPNLRIIAVFAVFFVGVAMASENGSYTGFSLSLYLFLYSFAGVVGLFSYDGVNHWQSYAAATPNGRRAMVDARYLLALLSVAAATAVSLGLGLGTRNESGITLAVLYCGVVLLYAAVTLPVSYRFGGDKSRLVMMVAVGAGTAVMVISGLSIMEGAESGIAASLLTVPKSFAILPVVGLAALAVSWLISRRIMADKEL